MVDASFKATVYIKNLVETSSVTVTPILYLSGGTRYTLPSITVDPDGISTIDVGTALQQLGIASSATLYGYMEVQYNWPWVPICVTVRDLDVTHSLIFYYGFLPPNPVSEPNQPPPASGVTTATVEGMWWKQEPNVSAFVTLTNTGGQVVSAQISVSDDHGVNITSESITLPPDGTMLVPLAALDNASVMQGGITVSYSSASVVLVNGALEDKGVGYSAVIPFSPAPQSAVSSTSTIAELGLMSGVADPMLKFPAGTVFTPYTVLRNISGQPLTATPTLWWMAGGVAQSANLPPITLAPHQTGALNVPAALAASALNSFAGSVNLVFQVQGASGALLATGGAVDQSNTYVFAVVPRGISWSAGKSLSYWSTANGDDTMITVWNPADEAQDFIFQLNYSGGHYRYPIHLQARATQMFNISEIVSSQVPDDQGNVIPPGVQEGSAELMGTQDEVQHVLVAMDSGIFNVVKATCGNYECETCNGVTAYDVDDDPWETSISGTNQLTFVETYNTGGQYNANGNWSSSNTGVATVGAGLVNGKSAGSATIDVVDTTEEPVYYSGCGYYLPGCPFSYFTPGGESPGNVVNITITGISPSQITLGSSGIMTISGSGFSQFSSGVTVNTQGLGIADVQIQGDNTITANYSAPCGTPIGGESITVSGATVDGGGGVSQNSWPISITDPQLPTPTISFDSNNINGTQNVVVGQQIALGTSEGSMPACAGSPSTNNWNIQGTFTGA